MMERLMIALVLVFAAFSARAESIRLTPPPAAQTQQQLERIYQQAAQYRIFTLSPPQRVAWFSSLFLNPDHPYLIDPLGEGAHGEFDQDPLYRFDGFDCTTFVETMLALSVSDSPGEFERHINQIRYHDGVVAFENRNHFTSLDWIPNNQRAGFIQDITAWVAGSRTKYSRTLIEKDSWYAKLGADRIQLAQTPSDMDSQVATLRALGQNFGKQISVIPYISKNDIDQHPEILDRIPSGSLLAIVRPNWQLRAQAGTNMDVSHQGLAVRVKGVLYFRHASQGKKVMQQPLLDYMRGTLASPTIGGMNVLAPRHP